jgi:Integrase core domain
MKQVARNITMADWGFLSNCKYLIHDRDSKFCKSFRSIIRFGGAEPLKLPTRSPNLNAFAERWVLSIKSECISGLIFFGEKSLLRTLQEYLIHYHEERNHQGKNNCLLFPAQDFNLEKKESEIACRTRF